MNKQNNGIMNFSKKITILYVNDNNKLPFIISDNFKNIFNTKYFIVSFNEVINYIKNNKIDIIIIEDNVSIIKKIRINNLHIPIILLTNNKNFILKSIDYENIKFLQFNSPIEKIIKTFSSIISKIRLKEIENKKIFKLKEYNKAINKSFIISKSDKNGNIIDINENFSKLTGYKKNEIIGKKNNLLSMNNN